MIALSQLTVREYLRSAFPYVLLLSLLALALVSRLFLAFSFGADASEMRNLGVSVVFLGGLLHAAFFGTRITRLEEERGTLSLLLTKPINLSHYLLGRFLGVLAAGLLHCVLLAVAIAALYAALPMARGERPAFLPLLASLLVALGPLPILCAVALFLSSVVGGFAAPIALIALFAAGSLAGDTVAATLLPDYSFFGLDPGAPPPIVPLLAYCVLYTSFFLLIAHAALLVRRPLRSSS